MAKQKGTTYKNALEELEQIISAVERNDTDVDELAEMVKKAMKLIKECKAKLRHTETNLNKLLDTPE